MSRKTKTEVWFKYNLSKPRCNLSSLFSVYIGKDS